MLPPIPREEEYFALMGIPGRWISGVLAILASVAGLSGATEPVLVPGRFGHALNATEVGHVAEGDRRYGVMPITVELWVQLTGGTGERVLLANGLRGSHAYWELAVREDGRLAAGFTGTEPRVVVADQLLEVGRWYYVGMVLERDRVELFLDGNPAGAAELTRREGPAPVGALGFGTRVEERRGSEVLIDDVRISSGVRLVSEPPRQPLVADRLTVGLWSFEESEADYLARWTPGGETNQRGLPYPQRVAEYEFEGEEDWIDGRWQETRKGPFLTHSTQIRGCETGPKNAVVLLGDDEGEAILFDLERCAATAGMTEALLKTDPARFGLLRKPRLTGRIQFQLSPVKAWRHGPAEGRAVGRPLERKEVRYRGLHLRDARVLFTFEVLGGAARDSSWVESHGGLKVIRRFLETEKIPGNVALTVAEMPSDPDRMEERGLQVVSCVFDGQRHAVALLGTTNSRLAVDGRDVLLALPKAEATAVSWLCWAGPESDWETFLELARRSSPAGGLKLLAEPGSRRWGEPLVTHGRIEEAADGPYAVDTITVPYDNPHRALFFIGGLDFLPNGDAAVCAAHGDVWVVGGLDADLDRVTWQRFATGLYQPLGLRVVDGKIIVLGRDQLTRLHDLNGDGEADFYETFNQDLEIQGQDHAFAMRLERDSDGNFYFLKSGGPPHGSALLKVTRDGSELSVVARGFRHPYGLGMSPRDEITVADNEGNWVPSSKIDLIRPDGFYGFLGEQSRAPAGVKPEPPLCYIPKVADNSSGGQVWVTSDRWGGYHVGEMLHLSWGRCTLHAVLRERVGEVWQAATVQFPSITFLSGAGEGRFHPHDGQLYVVGLTGWQTGAAADGSFQRVRYTGRPVRMPEAFHVHSDGLRIRFTVPVDGESVADVGRYRIDQWGYRWSSVYGSFHYSMLRPGEIGHDSLAVTSARLLDDGRTIFLEVPGLRAVDQIQVHVDLRDADGQPLRFDLYGTIHAVGMHSGQQR